MSKYRMYNKLPHEEGFGWTNVVVEAETYYEAVSKIQQRIIDCCIQGPMQFKAVEEQPSDE